MTDSVKTFADFDVPETIRRAIAEVGITTPFPIQELTLPLALSGADLIGQARTGTGKTLAFGIPLLARVDVDRNAPQALVIVPTRELCLQVHDDLVTAGRHKGVRVVAAYGGKAIDPQSEAIAAGAPVVVGTPGRLLDLRRRGVLDLSGVHSLVLDEADEMLDMGFLPDVEQLIEACSEDRQTLLFSATMPSEVVALARRYMHKPTFMRADVEEPRIAPETTQYFFSCHRMDKPAVVARILQSPDRGLCLLFTRTKRMADSLVRELEDHGVNAAAIHSDLRQEARERALQRFRKGTIDVLCATEVAARGLDIDEVTHVVNYDCPDDEKMYLHRIGRTGRAGATGVAVTLAVWNELARLEMIKKALDIDAETHEVFSTSPLLTQLFGLPERGKAPAEKKPARAEAAPAKPGRAKGAPAKPGVKAAPAKARRAKAATAETGPAKAATAETGPAEATPAKPGRAETAPTEGRTVRRRRPAEDTEPAEARKRIRHRRRKKGADTDTAADARPATEPVADDHPPTAAADAPATERAATAEEAVDAPTSERADRRQGADTRSVPRRRRVRRRSTTRPDGGAPTPSKDRSQRERRRPPVRDGDSAPTRRRSGRQGSDAPERTAAVRPDPKPAATRAKTATATAPSTEDSTDAARGSGKPALKRPLVITHLP